MASLEDTLTAAQERRDRWHRHVNVCWAPEDRVSDYKSVHPKFGMFGSINTKEACIAERGDFHSYMFTWMIHVFP